MTLFLGNANSFHLAAWFRVYRNLGFDTFDLSTIHNVVQSQSSFTHVSRISLGPKFVSYILLGLKLRFNTARWIHAHGASGYGFAAWLSGKPYIATVYGSEVLAEHGFLFRLAMRVILRCATAITVTSDMTRDVIIDSFGVNPDRIYSFHTGIDIEALDTFDGSNPAGTERILTERTIVFSMRNAAPHYRTQEIIKCCAELVGKGYPITLVVPLGNGDPLYFRDLQRKYPDCWIVYIDRRLENREMLAWMRLASVCVSYPITDQLSTTILESLYVGRAVVVGWLESYAGLSDLLGDDPRLHFAKDSSLSLTVEAALQQHSSKLCTQKFRDKYGIDQAAGHLSKILELLND